MAWAHLLAFDLFVGRWAYLDSRERAISPFLMAPLLLAVFLAGPIGFALYLGVRAVCLVLADRHLSPVWSTAIVAVLAVAVVVAVGLLARPAAARMHA